MEFLRLAARRCRVLAFTCALLLLQHALSAHDAIEEQIVRVTARMARDRATPQLLIERSELYRAIRHYPQALADLDRATRLAPQLPAADLGRALVFFDAGNPRGAVEAASRLLAREPGHAAALLVRGRALARLGRGRDAVNDFTRALDAKPHPDLYIERARTLRGTGPIGVEEALRGLDEGIRRLGPIVTLELEAIDFELKLSRYDAALSRLDLVSGQSARKESWLVRRGEILESAGRIDEARRSYRDALKAALGLPSWIQQTAASTALVTRIRAALARLDVSPHVRRVAPKNDRAS